MPNRFITLVILVLWLFATSWFLKRDVIPRWFVGAPPGVRSLTLTPGATLPEPGHWVILIPDNPNTKGRAGQNRSPAADQAQAGVEPGQRVVGRLSTSATRDPLNPEGMILRSVVELDSERLLEGTPFPKMGQGQILIETANHMDATGNLSEIHVTVRSAEDRMLWLTMDGFRQGETIVLEAKDQTGAVLLKKDFPYASGAGTQTDFQPFEAYPALQVGQSWRTQVVNPITRSVQEGLVEVRSQGVIRWQGRFVETWELVTDLKPLTARTWVRIPDGLVIRQEIPIPLLNLILERQTSPPPPPTNAAKPTPTPERVPKHDEDKKRDVAPQQAHEFE